MPPKQAPQAKADVAVVNLRGCYNKLIISEYQIVGAASADPAMQAKISELSRLIHACPATIPGAKQSAALYIKYINELTSPTGKIHNLYQETGIARSTIAVTASKILLETLKDAFTELCKIEKDWIKSRSHNDAEMYAFEKLIDSYKAASETPEEYIALIDKMTNIAGDHHQELARLEKAYQRAPIVKDSMHAEEKYAVGLIKEVRDTIKAVDLDDSGIGADLSEDEDEDEDEFFDADDKAPAAENEDITVDDEGVVYHEAAENLIGIHFNSELAALKNIVGNSPIDLGAKINFIKKELDYMKHENIMPDKADIHVVQVARNTAWIGGKFTYNHDNINIEQYINEACKVKDSQINIVELNQAIGWIEYTQIKKLSEGANHKIKHSLNKLEPEIRLATEIAYMEDELESHRAEYDAIDVTVKTKGKIWGVVEEHKTLTQFLEDSILHAVQDMHQDHPGTGLKYMDHCMDAVHKAGAVAVIIDLTH